LYPRGKDVIIKNDKPGPGSKGRYKIERSMIPHDTTDTERISKRETT